MKVGDDAGFDKLAGVFPQVGEGLCLLFDVDAAQNIAPAGVGVSGGLLGGDQ